MFALPSFALVGELKLSVRLHDHDDRIALDRFAGPAVHGGNHAVGLAVDAQFHLHRFENGGDVAGPDPIADHDVDLEDHAGHRRPQFAARLRCGADVSQIGYGGQRVHATEVVDEQCLIVLVDTYRFAT